MLRLVAPVASSRLAAAGLFATPLCGRVYLLPPRRCEVAVRRVFALYASCAAAILCVRPARRASSGVVAVCQTRDSAVLGNPKEGGYGHSLGLTWASPEAHTHPTGQV